MNIIYFGTFVNKEYFEKVLDKTKHNFSVAQYKFEKGILYGLINNGVKIERAYCMPSLQFGKIYNNIYIKAIDVSDDRIKIQTLPILKLKLFGKLFLSIYIFFKYLFLSKSKIAKDTVFLFSSNYLPVSIPLLIVSRIRKFKCIITLTDCSQNIIGSQIYSTRNKFRAFLLKLKGQLAQIIEKSFSGYVFLTKYMNYLINPRSKPYTIVEGVFNSSDYNKLEITKKVPERENKNKIILYSGSLYEQYGIDKLIDVMNYIDQNIELHIYGNGPYIDNILQASNVNPNIKYMGFVDQITLESRLKSSDLLINLRNPEYEYTKLSFPSKMFDYMVSGVPTFTTRLEGIPDEYYDYLYYTEHYDSKIIAKEISTVCNVISPLDRSKLARKSYEFILKNKNEDVQTKKIITMIEGMITNEKKR